MKQFLRYFLSAALLLSSFALLADHASNCGSDTSCNVGCSTSCSTTCGSDNSVCDDFGKASGYLNLRSTGANTARELVGWQWVIHGGQGRLGESFGAMTLAYEYQRSFWNSNLARALLGSNKIALQGSHITGVDRTPGALIADMFGLSDTFSDVVTVKPSIQNHTIDFNAFYAFGDCGSCWDGAYLRLHAPLTIGKWSVNLCSGNSISSHSYSPCRFGTGSYVPVDNAISALEGKAVLASDSASPLLKAGYFSPCNKYKVRLADIDLIAGYNLIWEEAKHLGAYLQLVVPTGNKPDGRTLFQTVVGNRQHVEFGGGLSAHGVFWDNQCDQSLSGHFEGNVTHMFTNHQNRLLDFKNNGAGSRYALLREFGADGLTPTGNLVSATSTNFQSVNVGVSVKGDATFKLAYRWCGFGLDLGYNIYGHSAESLTGRYCNTATCNGFNGNYGIAGITDVCATEYQTVTNSNGCLSVADVTLTDNYPLLNSTFSNANNIATTPVNNWTADAWTPIVPNTTNRAAVLARPSRLTQFIGETTTLDAIPGACPDSEIPGEENYMAPFSTTPVMIQLTDLCPESAAAPAVLTQKIFLFTNYQWADECEYNPHVGLGGSVELSGRRCGSRPSLSQWGVMIKGGMSF